LLNTKHSSDSVQVVTPSALHEVAPAVHHAPHGTRAITISPVTSFPRTGVIVVVP
jgi:hypothetical protein